MDAIKHDNFEKYQHEIELIYSLSKTLNTGLDRRVVKILIDLLELGIQPESLVDGNKF